MERTPEASREQSTDGERAQNERRFAAAPISTQSRHRGHWSSRPGGGLWLLKWALVVVLLVALLLLTLPGLGLG